MSDSLPAARPAGAPSPEAMRALLSPRSVAVVGASSDPGKAGGRPIDYMKQLGYAGELYPVNPGRSQVQGLQAYASLGDVPGPVELCVLAVPADQVEGYVAECAERGIPAVVVFASGYAEVGAEGAARQERLRELAAGAGMALAGPNCLGLIDVRAGAAPTFTTALERRRELAPGSIAFVTQSGAVGAFVLGKAQDEGVGFSHFVTTGNEAVVGFADYAEHLLDDPETNVIAGYVEGVDGPRLVALAERALEADVPLVLMKVGASAAGAAASAAHTGKLAGVDAVYDAVFRRHGITRATSIEELLDLSRVLTHPRRPRGRGVAVVSTSGGAAILMADWCERLGLDLAELAEPTTARLREALPWFASGRNPVDTTGRPLWDEGMLQAALAAVADDPSVDTVLCHVGLAPGCAPRISAEVLAAAEASDKPFLVCWLPELDPEPHAALARAGIPVFADPVRMTRGAAALAAYAEARARRPGDGGPPPVQAVAPPPAGAVVTEAAAKAWLADQGVVPAPAEAIARSAAEAVAEAERIGYPVCLKVLSPDVPHRSDVGGVRIGVETPQAVEAAYGEVVAAVTAAVPHATLDGVLVQELAPAGVELIASGFRDPAFGPCVLCGIGGVLAEVLQDTVIRPAPVSVDEAAEMLGELRGAALLHGPRGSRPSDVAAAAEALAGLSRVIAGAPEDVEAIEINPLLVLAEGEGVRALDALVTRREEAT